MQSGVVCFFAGGSGILNSNRHVWQWNETMLCEIHIRDFKSHFRRDFLAYCTGPVSVHLVMVCVGCSFDNFFSSLFAQFKTTTKSQANYVFLYPFSNMAISSHNNAKTVFYTSKLYGLTGMHARTHAHTHIVQADRGEGQCCLT